MVRLRNKKHQNSTAAFLCVGVLVGVSGIALTAAAVPAHARSQPTTGFYIGGAAGANIMEDNRFRNGGGNIGETAGC